MYECQVPSVRNVAIGKELREDWNGSDYILAQRQTFIRTCSWIRRCRGDVRVISFSRSGSTLVFLKALHTDAENIRFFFLASLRTPKLRTPASVLSQSLPS